MRQRRAALFGSAAACLVHRIELALTPGYLRRQGRAERAAAVARMSVAPDARTGAEA